ncbi:MAG: MurR/RpiR family transcriptional regulator [Clostridia bacterium]|nr:MurR/RpiR family transcriptional regulator [Clostridia bacterium]
MNLSEAVRSALDSMTRSEYRVGTYFLTNPNDFAFETLDSIAERIGTSTTSVIRFCRRLGFLGYKPFQEEVRASFKYELTLPDKLERTAKTDGYDTQLSKNWRSAVNCIEQTFSSLSPSQINEAIHAIINASRVFCFGLKESFALAHYAYTRFLTVRDNVFLLTAGQSGEIESILSLGEGDACIFFLFHRYTRQSPEILKLLKKRGVTVILITSPPYDEIEANASVLLPCFVNIDGIKNSAAAPICVIDHLCNAVVVLSGEKALDHMKESEILFKEFTF